MHLIELGFGLMAQDRREPPLLLHLLPATSAPFEMRVRRRRSVGRSQKARGRSRG
jgi:hypothetical protein